MSNPYDSAGGNEGHQDPSPSYDQGADPYGPSAQNQPAPYQGNQYGSNPYDSNQYGSNQYGSNQYGSNQYGSNQYGGGQPGANPYGNPYAAAPPLKTNGLAIASLVTSLGGLLGFFCGFLGLAAPVGLVLGLVARKQIRENPTGQTGEGIALGGVIAGAIITGLMAIFLVLYIAFFGWSILAAPNY